MDYISSIGIENLGPYKVYSRREIISILQGIMETNQLVRMVFNNGSETIVTTILEVNPDTGLVIVDCGKERGQNQRVVDSDNISFESTLERIRILFFTRYVDGCLHDGRAAFCFAIPTSLVRLQRREFYRVQAQREPVLFNYETELGPMQSTMFVRDVSAGGLGLHDDEMILNCAIGKIYQDCRIFLTDKKIITVDLQIRSVQDMKAPNGKKFRRVGCKFEGLSNRALMEIQRHITQLERDLNAKASGLV